VTPSDVSEPTHITELRYDAMQEHCVESNPAGARDLLHVGLSDLSIERTLAYSIVHIPMASPTFRMSTVIVEDVFFFFSIARHLNFCEFTLD
jgi:hypothetical protein